MSAGEITLMSLALELERQKGEHNTHVAECTERWKTTFNRLSEVREDVKTIAAAVSTDKKEATEKAWHLVLWLWGRVFAVFAAGGGALVWMALRIWPPHA